MDEQCKKQFIEWTAASAKTEAGSFLKEFDWQEIPVSLSGLCNAENGITGMYAFGKILLRTAVSSSSKFSAPTSTNFITAISNGNTRYCISSENSTVRSSKNRRNEVTDNADDFLEERMKK